MYNDELMHYGVLGMKWGQHRARKNYEKARMHRTYAADYDPKDLRISVSDKQRAKMRKVRSSELTKAAKYEAKAKRIESKHKDRAGTKAYNRVKNQSTGKLVVKSMLMGTYGALKYEQARARNATKGQAALQGILYNVGNQLSYGGLAVAEPRINAGKHR